MNHIAINTPKAPQAIGTYSQAILAGNTLYVSGQIPLDPQTNALISGSIEEKIDQVFKNTSAILTAAGSSFTHVVKVNIYLTDLAHFALVNTVMTRYCNEPYPARAVIGVASLPKQVEVEMDVIALLDGS